MSSFISVDPGINTGYCCVINGELTRRGIIRGRGKTFEDRVENVVEKFYEDVLHFCVDETKIYLEWPSFQNLVSRQTFSIPKLAFLIGRLYETCKTYEFTPILIPVTKYRGNCPKSVLWRRAEKYFGVKGLKNHEGDSIALAMYLIKNNI